MAACLLVSKNALAFPMQVTSLSDNDLADSVCTLREAIIAVNTAASYRGCGYAGQTEISVPAGTLTLVATLPAVTATVTITGAGHASTIIDAADSFSIGRWQLQSVGGVYLTDMTLKRFKLGGPWIETGGIAVLRSVKIDSAGDATSQGGCLMVKGLGVVESSQFENCRGHTGAAIRIPTGQLYLSSSTVLKSRGEHGIITADTGGWLEIRSSTIASNLVGAASGVAGEGAVYAGSNSSVSIRSSTIAYNKKAAATAAGGGTALFESSSASMYVSKSVIYGEQAGALDCVGTIGMDYSAVVGGRGCPSTGLNFAVSTPQLQPLSGTEVSPDGVVFADLPRWAGGVGRVYLPSPTSPLIGLILGSSCEPHDQRGIARHNTCTIGAVNRGRAALVVGNTALSTADATLKTLLENLGFAVTVFKDTTVTAASIGTSTNVVVISESVVSTSVNTKLRDLAIGTVVLEPWLFDDMNMTTAANLGSASQTQTYLLAGPVASAVGSLGLVTATTATSTFGWGLPLVGPTQASVHAYSSSLGTQHQLFEYKAGNSMIGGFTAPNARVGAFMMESVAGAFTSTGSKIFQEAVLRAAEHDPF